MAIALLLLSLVVLSMASMGNTFLFSSYNLEHKQLCATVKCQRGADCIEFNGLTTCECRTVCPSLYAPVCGSDGNIYENLCKLSVADCQSMGRVNEEDMSLCRPPPPPPPPARDYTKIDIPSYAPVYLKSDYRKSPKSYITNYIDRRRRSHFKRSANNCAPTKHRRHRRYRHGRKNLKRHHKRHYRSHNKRNHKRYQKRHHKRYQKRHHKRHHKRHQKRHHKRHHKRHGKHHGHSKKQKRHTSYVKKVVKNYRPNKGYKKVVKTYHPVTSYKKVVKTYNPSKGYRKVVKTYNPSKGYRKVVKTYSPIKNYVKVHKKTKKITKNYTS